MSGNEDKEELECKKPREQLSRDKVCLLAASRESI